MSMPMFEVLDLKRLYLQSLSRDAIGLLIAMVDVLESAQGSEDTRDFAETREWIQELEYSHEEDCFLIAGSRAEYTDLCGLLLEAWETSQSEIFRQLAANMLAGVDAADSEQFATARWN